MSSHKPVLIHSCFAAVDPIDLFHDDRPVRFHLNPNVSCECNERTKFRDRDEMISHGEAMVLVFQSGLGSFIPEWREIVVTKRLLRIPIARKITMHNIEAAFGCGAGGSEFQQERVDEYGRLARFGGQAAWSAAVRDAVVKQTSGKVEVDEEAWLTALNAALIDGDEEMVA